MFVALFSLNGSLVGLPTKRMLTHNASPQVLLLPHKQIGNNLLLLLAFDDDRGSVDGTTVPTFRTLVGCQGGGQTDLVGRFLAFQFDPDGEEEGKEKPADTAATDSAPHPQCRERHPCPR